MNFPTSGPSIGIVSGPTTCAILALPGLEPHRRQRAEPNIWLFDCLAILPQRHRSRIRLGFIHRSQSKRRMGISPSGPHLGGDPNRLHQLLARGPITKGGFRVPVDAIRALRYMRYRNGNELLGLCRQSSAGKDLPAKRLKGFFRLGHKGPPFLGEFWGSGWNIRGQSLWASNNAIRERFTSTKGCGRSGRPAKHDVWPPSDRIKTCLAPPLKNYAFNYGIAFSAYGLALQLYFVAHSEPCV